MKRPDTLHWILFGLLVLTLGYFLINPYRYHIINRGGNGNLVRIHRVTGEAERLTSTGWKPMAQPRFVLGNP